MNTTTCGSKAKMFQYIETLLNDAPIDFYSMTFENKLDRAIRVSIGANDEDPNEEQVYPGTDVTLNSVPGQLIFGYDGTGKVVPVNGRCFDVVRENFQRFVFEEKILEGFYTSPGSLEDGN